MNAHFLISEQGWQIIGWTMVYYLAVGTLVALLAAALRWLSRSADPTLRYATSLAVFAVLALMPVGIAIWLSQTPASEFPLSQLAPAPAPPVVDLAITPLETDSPLAQLQTPAEHEPAWTTTQVIEYLPWVWLAGTPLTFVLLATGLIGAERLRRTSRIVTEGPVHDAGERLRAALGVGRRVTLAICDRLATPLMVGIVRPIILLPPAALTGWSADELEMVLLHELAHIRRWDNLVNLLQRIVESLLFFHPAVWIVSRWVRRDREDCCDAVVVAHTAKPQAYAELLVALASTTQPLAGLAMARHPLAGRIRRILHLEDETMLVSRNTLVAISTALLAVVLAVSCYSPRETEADEATERVATEGTESTEKTSEEPKASRVVPDPGARATSPFPTLEEQRAADVAYKVLGVELETLTPEELDRVKAHGYQGGLRIDAHERGGLIGLPQNGDLLVGLHVWPTPSLDAVNEILSRDDLDQLSPMKFYVVRGVVQADGNQHAREAKLVFKLVTGRVQLDLDAWRAIETVRQRMLQKHLEQWEREVDELDEEILQLEHDFTYPGNNHKQRLTEIALKKAYARKEQLLQEREDKVLEMAQRTRSSVTRESLEKLHKQLVAELQEKMERFQTLSKELDSSDSASTSAMLSMLVSDIRMIQQQIIGKKAELLDIEVIKTLAVQQANSTSALEAAIQEEMARDPMIQSFQQEQLVVTQQMTQLRAITKRKNPPEVKRLQEHLKTLEQQIQEYRVAKEAELRKRFESSPNDLLAQVMSEYKIRRRSAESDLLELKEQYEEKMEEVQRKGQTSGPLAILESEITALQEVERTMDLKLRSWDMEQLLRERKERQPRQQATLLYDGKTFDEWRKLWKTELKTEKRIECIKALAAFGRAGKGKEAAEAILEIVKEYDWHVIGDGPLGTLQKTALETMRGRYFRQVSIRAIPTDDWLPVLTKEVLAGNKRIVKFAEYVYPAAWYKAMHGSDEEARQRINQVFKDMGPDAESYLLQHLIPDKVTRGGIPDPEGKLQIRETKISIAAADLLREITGSDEAAIKHLESVVGRKDTLYPRDLEQEKFLLKRLKSRQEQ